MSNDVKVIRGQVRQVVKEELAVVLGQELYAELKNHVDSRLNEVEKYIKDTMQLMSNRQKETLRYLLEAYVPKEEIDKTIKEEPKSE